MWAGAEDLLRWGTNLIRGFVGEPPAQSAQLGRAELDTQ